MEETFDGSGMGCNQRLYGTEQTLQDLGTIADTVKLNDTLRDRGYSEEGIDPITHQNFVNHRKHSVSAS